MCQLAFSLLLGRAVFLIDFGLFSSSVFGQDYTYREDFVVDEMIGRAR